MITTKSSTRHHIDQTSRMKAIVYTEYGPPEVLHIEEVERPVPAKNEVLVRVHAASVNFGDLIARHFNDISPREFTMPLPFWIPARLDFGFTKPKKPVLGSEFSGVIAATGSEVTRFGPGDPVFGYLGQKMGSYAEFLRIPAEGNIAAKPVNLSFEEAAAVPYGAITALNLLRKANIGNGSTLAWKGKQILINGASGGIGSAAVQLAKYYGAEVTGVCSTRRLDYVNSLGADRVIDYTQEDFTTNGETYDLIFDIPGKCSYAKCKDSLKSGGHYLPASFKMRQVARMVGTSLFSGRSGRRVICALSMEKPEDLPFIRELIETGKIRAPIDKSFPMEDAAEAHRYVEEKSAQGKVVITMK